MKSRRNIFFAFLTLIVAFALLEFGLRMLALGAGAVEALVIPNPQTKFIDHPYLTIAMKPNYREVIPDHPSGGDFIFETNSFGYRGPEFEPQKPPDTYRIVVVGGSAVVTGRLYDTTFTAILEDRLADEFEGVSFEVINAGMPGYTSTQELFLIETQVLGWEPDLVLIYDGRNDVFQASMPDYIPYWNQRNMQVMTFLNTGGDPLRKHLFTWDLIAHRVFHEGSRPEQDYKTPQGVRHAYTAHPEALDVYEHNLETAAILLQGYGVQPAFAFQPSLLVTDKPLSDVEKDLLDALDTRFADAHRELLLQAADRMGEVADRNDVPWVDLSGVFDDQTDRMFVDDVHQMDAGNVLIADTLLEMLEPVIRADLAE